MESLPPLPPGQREARWPQAYGHASPIKAFVEKWKRPFKERWYSSADQTRESKPTRSNCSTRRFCAGQGGPSRGRRGGKVTCGLPGARAAVVRRRMETVTLPTAFPAAYRRVYLAKFEHVTNGGALKEALVAASKTPPDSAERKRLDFAFLDARLVVSRQQLLTAVVQAIVASNRLSSRTDAQVGMKTPSIHSEILWTLHPSHNIADALRQFGVSATTETLILVHVGALPPVGPDPAALVRHMDALVHDANDGIPRIGAGRHAVEGPRKDVQVAGHACVPGA
ncbi:hypothetical protein MNAN1_000456 [Malassezia nana]|uniref:EKC/KEOPS complex subunit CGI121 n=1 Tax=Malassezia nana TaxID=180528 RepID=A0AAF0EIU4_9BASI|nr:hypothetical protein MNAN1_000456 [Malassezia nana]